MKRIRKLSVNLGDEKVKVEFSLEKKAWRSDFIKQFERLTDSLVIALNKEGYFSSTIKIR